jgi:serine/threonine protein phosphatase 1
MANILSRLFQRQDSSLWPHRLLETWPAAIYAVGDIHGCLDLLIRLEAAIEIDAEAFPGPKLLILLGDYVDRGPDSAGVIDHLMRPPPAGCERACLVGNHEAMMLDFLLAPRTRHLWLQNGGLDTLRSYGADVDAIPDLSRGELRDMVEMHVPAEHLDFLTRLSFSISLPDVLFVHAGRRPGVPMADQTQHDLLWSRPNEFPEPETGLLVHGHTPSTLPVVRSHRICVDTGAFSTNTLTAVRLVSGQTPVFLNSRRG